MKRFYKAAEIVAHDGAFEIHLDGKPVKTPSGGVLRVEDAALAGYVCDEWLAQDKQILPETMPVTQIVITAIDRVPGSRAEMRKLTLAYLDTDLLCYRADESEPVFAHQSASWDPVLSWFENKYGIRLLTTTGLSALRQPDEAHKAVAGYADGLNDLGFTVMQLVTSLSGSLILALAFMQGGVTAEDILRACRVEESFKGSIYNEDFYGAAPNEEKKLASLRRDLAACAIVVDCL